MMPDSSMSQTTPVLGGTCLCLCCVEGKAAHGSVLGAHVAKFRAGIGLRAV